MPCQITSTMKDIDIATFRRPVLLILLQRCGASLGRLMIFNLISGFLGPLVAKRFGESDLRSPLESLANRTVTPAPKTVGAISEAARSEPNQRTSISSSKSCLWEHLRGAFPGGVNFSTISRRVFWLSSYWDDFLLASLISQTRLLPLREQVICPNDENGLIHRDVLTPIGSFQVAREIAICKLLPN